MLDLEVDLYEVAVFFVLFRDVKLLCFVLDQVVIKHGVGHHFHVDFILGLILIVPVIVLRVIVLMQQL